MVDLRYTNGYKAALRHVIQWFEDHSIAIQHSKLRSYKGCMFLLKKLHEKADWLMQEGSSFELTLAWDEVEEAGGRSLEELGCKQKKHGGKK